MAVSFRFGLNFDFFLKGLIVISRHHFYLSTLIMSPQTYSARRESLSLIHFKCIPGYCELMRYVSTHTYFLNPQSDLVISALLSLGWLILVMVIIHFYLYFVCQQSKSPCMIALNNGGSKAPIRLSGRGRSCLTLSQGRYLRRTDFS